jgi:uncharacterized protein (TIGR03086 family)
MTTLIDRIDAAIAMTDAIVDGMEPSQLAAPSVCEGWDVRTELNHLVGGMRIFTAELNSAPAGDDHDADWLGADPRQAYVQAAVADRAAWRRPGVLDTTVHISLGALPGPMAAVVHLTEVLVHGVDLAVATGQQRSIDEQQCADLLATMHDMGGMDPYRVPGMFGPELPAPAGASPHRQLLAYLGRAA